MFKHIFVATDGSSLSEKAVNAAIDLARALGARLTVFHATQEFPIAPFPEYAIVAEPLTSTTWKAQEDKRARHLLEKAEAKAKKAGVVCDTSFSVAAHPYEAILKAAKQARCDLIVMASHGRRGIKGIILGSEANKVITHSKLPVLVYR